MTRAEPKAPLKPKGRPKAAKAAPPAEATATPAAVAPRKGSAEITALVHLAEVDVAIEGDPEAKPAARGRASDERKRLGTRLSRELHDAYDLARRAGRRPAVVRLVSSVCSGCHVRLPTTLDQKIRGVRGVAPCPHCLRLVYDPDWLHP